MRSNIFHTTCNIGGRICNLVIDGGSCENVISKEVVDKLGLKIEDHPHLYKLTWLKTGNDIRVSKRCMAPFQLGRSSKIQFFVM